MLFNIFQQLYLKEDDDVKCMFQINGFKSQEASNVKVNGAWALFTSLLLGNKDV